MKTFHYSLICVNVAYRAYVAFEGSEITYLIIKCVSIIASQCNFPHTNDRQSVCKLSTLVAMVTILAGKYAIIMVNYM